MTSARNDIDALLRSIPKPTESEQVAIDIINEQVAEEVRRIRKYDSAIETCLYLRANGIPFKEVLAISKRIGERMKPTQEP